MPKVGQRIEQPSEPPEQVLPAERLAMGLAGSDTCYKEGGAILDSPTGQLASPTAGAANCNNQGGKALSTLSPSVRLATLGPPEAIAQGLGSPGPDVRLAHKVNYQGDRMLEEGGRKDDPRLPALLVSYVYLRQFLENRHRYHYRDWVMDSGAFSAFNSGTEIKLQDYIDCCKRLLAEDPTLTEVFALDVIGNEKASLRNTEEMWRQGVPAIPCFHANEPWEFLIHIAKEYPKIALGGVALQKAERKLSWAKQCFARVWPKKIHGFAYCSETALMTLPFHSVDATNWELGPCRYGQWKAFGGARVSVRGSQQNLRAEVEWYLDLEQRVRRRWKKEMTLLQSLDKGPSGRLVPNAHPGRQAAKDAALGPSSVRLDGEPNAAGGKRVEAALIPAVRLSAISDSNTGNDNRSEAKIEAFTPRSE